MRPSARCRSVRPVGASSSYAGLTHVDRRASWRHRAGRPNAREPPSRGRQENGPRSDPSTERSTSPACTGRSTSTSDSGISSLDKGIQVEATCRYSPVSVMKSRWQAVAVPGRLHEPPRPNTSAAGSPASSPASDPDNTTDAARSARRTPASRVSGRQTASYDPIGTEAAGQFLARGTGSVVARVDRVGAPKTLGPLQFGGVPSTANDRGRAGQRRRPPRRRRPPQPITRPVAR